MHPLDILFWTCLMLGGGYLLVSLLLGSFTHGGHHDLGAGGAAGDIGAHGFDAGALDGGGFDTGGHAIDAGGHAGGDAVSSDHGHADHGDGRFSALSLISPLTLSGLLAGFGGTGAIGRYIGVSPPASVLYAVLGGIASWGAAFLVVTQLFGKSQGTSHHRREELIGCRAEVITPITAERPGVVTYIVAGTRQSIPAVADDDDPIPAGTAVRIRKVDQNRAHVVRLHF